MPKRNSILIVDDDERIRASLSTALSDEGTDVHAVGSAEQALSTLGDSRADIVLADVRMPGMSGLELLELLRERMPEVDVILMTAYEDLPTVAQAMGSGAVDFLVKPLDLRQLRRVLHATLRDRATRSRPHAAMPQMAPGVQLIGRHRSMVEIFKLVGQVARTHTTVVIRGESGTGKELIARAIHAGSRLAGEPFVPVNCTALPATLLESELFGHVRGAFTGAAADRKGRFAMAGSGTIFLDEIGDTSDEFQAKLLRVLQEGEYFPVGADRSQRTDARVIAATHRDLEAMVSEGTFREDLYYRLRVVEITVPPLRVRMEDVPLLAEHLVQKACSSLGKPPHILSPEAVDLLRVHSWPGNVRELENCLTRAAVTATGEVIRPEHITLTTPSRSAESVDSSLDEVERDHIARVLQVNDWNKSRTAETLGISRPRLDRLIDKYRIERPGGG
jgi:DNA-binding NtrC family response regulator